MDSLSGVGVIDKGVHILQALREQPLDLAGLQQACSLPRATAHRLVVALEHHHLVRRDAQGRFCLGFELVALGRVAAEQFPLGEIAAPALADLRELCGESVQLYVREDDARRCVVSLQSPHALRWIVPEGSLLPLDVGSAGRVLTGARLSPGGWIESVEEREAGVASVSAPVVDGRGATIAAVGVSGPIERLTRSPGERFGPRVADAAAAISRAVATRT
jgi:DNA-binding IclR family transcriptional regulator